MTISLSTLLADPGLALRLVVGRRDDVEIGWAHSSDLSDPTPFLERGNLLLTTGTQFDGASAPDTYEAYVGRLTEVGVAALGYGTEVVQATPELLVAACERGGLPLLEVPYRTPF
ncbi:MAG TPA: PucR family transcriptional regulator ligand-binding domain-containing protein, partial [Microlunatus sp.]|nr:PucR family transcriptional regulator ligand-binding domain-containing protein [Microlunatus sp.]